MLILGYPKPTWIASSLALKRSIAIIAGMVRPPVNIQLTTDVTTTITDLVLQAISSKANLLDSFVSLYAVFVGALHRIIGVEFGESKLTRTSLMVGAHFLHTLIMRYKNPSPSSAPAATIYETPDASKESLNLLTLVAELYNVGVVGPKLIYDLIREFVDHGLRETDVEGLLKIVKRKPLL